MTLYRIIRMLTVSSSLLKGILMAPVRAMAMPATTGSTVLDAAVERLLRGARLPAFPTGMDQEQVTVTLQIRYALER
jgi:hypothetical protein